MVVLTPPVSPAFSRKPRLSAAQSALGCRAAAPCATPTLLGRATPSGGARKRLPSVEAVAAAPDLGRQRDDEVWLVIGGTGMAGFGVLKKLSERGEAGGLVLAATRGSAGKAWMGGALPGITALEVDINDSGALKRALCAHPPVTHVFYSALVRTSFDGFSKSLDAMNIVAVRELQRSVGPAFIRASSACCCGGTGVYDTVNTVTGCGDVEDNRVLFQKVLGALDTERLRYCCVVTGAKHYGMHLGPHAWPQYEEPFREDLAEAPGESAYAALEEELLGLCARLPQLSSLVLRPTFILGPVPRPAASCMNLSLCLGIYAMLCKQLNLPLRFLGSPELWTARHNFSHSERIAQLALNGGAALAALPQGRHMALNAGDAESFCYSELWHELAAWAGCDWTGPEGRNGISFGYAMGRRSIEELSESWEQLVALHGLREYRLKDVLNVTFLEQSMSVPYNARLSAEKAKRLQWASPSRNGGWMTLHRALLDLSSQRLLPETP